MLFLLEYYINNSLKQTRQIQIFIDNKKFDIVMSINPVCLSAKEKLQ